MRDLIIKNGLITLKTNKSEYQWNLKGEYQGKTIIKEWRKCEYVRRIKEENQRDIA